MCHLLAILGFIFFYSTIILNGASYSKNCVDICIFSYDRPMQLELLCWSINKNIIKNDGLGAVHVIYRCSNDIFSQGYDIVKEMYPEFIFHKQDNPPNDFKPLIMDNLFNDSSGAYIMFAVDDNIVVDQIDLSECMSCMQTTNAYGFFLRLGLNIDYCYMQKQSSGVPKKYEKIDENVFIYKFCDGKCDWNYPNNVDMTIYKKNDIKKTFAQIQMKNPWFETDWARRANFNLTGLFYGKSKVLNLTINLVGSSRSVNDWNQFDKKWKSEKLDIYSTANMCEMFLSGYRINLDQFENLKHNTVHVCFEPAIEI